MLGSGDPNISVPIPQSVSENNQKVFILNLHGIGTPKREVPPSERRVWITEAQFIMILDYVQDRPDVRLTFDDANESDFTIGLPALQARGLKAGFFIVSDRVDKPAFLSRAQLDGLVSAGMSIGNHGLSHRPWASLDGRNLQDEIVNARTQLESITGTKIREASCPFGSYNRRVIRGLRECGYTSVYTSDCGTARPGAFILPRNSAYSTWSRETVQKVLSDNETPLRRCLRQAKLAMKRWR